MTLLEKVRQEYEEIRREASHMRLAEEAQYSKYTDYSTHQITDKDVTMRFERGARNRSGQRGDK
jgi:hypothetical protein